jgi:hypothetical protein
MLPIILVAVGAYLIGDSVLEDKKYSHGGKTQGYDDKEDERLAMEHGKMSKKDLDSTHARRDDARFEERGKMAKGGDVKDYSGNYYSTYDFVHVNKLQKEADALFGKDWEAEDDASQILVLTDSLGGGYTTYVSEGKGDWERLRQKHNLYNETNDDNYDIFVVHYGKKKKMAKGGKLVGKQKNLDVNKNGKLDAEDFKILRKGK